MVVKARLTPEGPYEPVLVGFNVEKRGFTRVHERRELVQVAIGEPHLMEPTVERQVARVDCPDLRVLCARIIDTDVEVDLMAPMVESRLRWALQAAIDEHALDESYYEVYYMEGPL